MTSRFAPVRAIRLLLACLVLVFASAAPHASADKITDPIVLVGFATWARSVRAPSPKRAAVSAAERFAGDASTSFSIRALRHFEIVGPARYLHFCSFLC